MRIFDRDLRQMGPAERDAALSELVVRTRTFSKEDLRELDQEIGTFERKYKIRSRDLLDQIEAGERAESDEVCRWLMLLNRRRRLETRIEAAQARTE